MAAQIYLKLGEVGAESGMCVVSLRGKVTNNINFMFTLFLVSLGNYSQSLEDFNECLTLQLKHLSSHSRLLAETHYQLGTTYSYTAQYSKAIEHFSSSIKVIESRLGSNNFHRNCLSKLFNNFTDIARSLFLSYASSGDR